MVSLALSLVVGVTSVTLTWNFNPANPTPPATHVRVYRAQAPCTKYVLDANGLNTTSWTDKGVHAGLTYCYFVTTINPKTGLESGKSNVVKVVVP